MIRDGPGGSVAVQLPSGRRGHSCRLGERVRAVVRSGQDRYRLASERLPLRCPSATRAPSPGGRRRTLTAAREPSPPARTEPRWRAEPRSARGTDEYRSRARPLRARRRRLAFRGAADRRIARLAESSAAPAGLRAVVQLRVRPWPRVRCDHMVARRDALHRASRGTCLARFVAAHRCHALEADLARPRASRTGSVSVRVVEAQFPTLSQERDAERVRPPSNPRRRSAPSAGDP